MNLSQQLEALLFFKSEPLTVTEIGKLLGISSEDVREAAQVLKESLVGRGVALMEEGDTYMLATAPEMSELIARITKEALERDPGKAGMEVLAIILYQGPQTRAQIDYVRGVNSTFAIRQLMMRGLIERDDNPHDARSFLYKPTLQLLSFLGVSSRDELPELETLRDALAALTHTSHDTGTSPDGSTPATPLVEDEPDA
jgi:segregation and condensation protein B